ncbi:excisionase family DNA-binding protein [Luteolibacter algae]|uniref:Excisionase family DNA-binding protein n=1 Tax=Luteolibacter algae TaxID=454151 RepID=A0ABW5D2N3_9BACT
MKTLNTIKTASVQDKLITKKMAAQRLSVSTRTIDRMAAEGLLEKVFVGSAPRFRNSDIDRIVESGL